MQKGVPGNAPLFLGAVPPEYSHLGTLTKDIQVQGLRLV